jgi:antirestriction protein ArdC
MSSQTEIRRRITDQIVAALSDPTKLPPWRKSWTSFDANIGHPCNALTRKPYRGINTLLLGLSAQRRGFQSRHWLTFRQAKEMGVSVRSGEKSTHIIFFKPIRAERTTEDSEEKQDTFFLMRSYCVFNVEQTTGLDHLRVGNAPLTAVEIEQRHEQAEAVIAATGADIRHGGDRAFYSPTGDFIQMPHRQQFEKAEAYYQTAGHELTHWAEHPARLNWDRSKPENSYAMGELIAELGGCYLMGELGLPTGEDLTNHAAYLKHWLAGMQNDTKFLFRAAAQASRTVDYLFSFSRPQEASTEDDEALVA